MHAVAAQPARLEARGEIGDVAGETRIAGRLLGEGETQQQRIDTGALAQQRDHLACPVVVEQPVGESAEQVGVVAVDRQRVAEALLRRGVVEPLGRLGGARHRPDTATAGVLRASSWYCARVRVMARNASGAWPVSDMIEAVQTAGTMPSTMPAIWPQSRSAGFVLGARLMHGGERQPGLCGPWVGFHDAVQRGEAGIEIVVALKDGRAQQQHLRRCVGAERPGGEGGLGAAEEARVAQLTRLHDVEPRDLHGEVDVSAVLGESRVQLAQGAARRIAGARHTLEHEGIVGGDGGRRQRRRRQEQRR